MSNKHFIKKNTKYVISIILTLVLFLQSCTPLPTGGYPTPTCPDNFILNITTQVQAYNTLNTNSYYSKGVKINNDSILFDVSSFTGTDYMSQDLHLAIINVKDSVELFEYVALVNSNTVNAPAVLGANITINQALPSSSYVWKPVIATLPVSSSLYFGDLSLASSSTNWLDFTINQMMYIVLRKLENTKYKYFSIKIKRESTTTYLSVGSKLIVYNGCTSYNSITTGQ
jgi:hypothetical protein